MSSAKAAKAPRGPVQKGIEKFLRSLREKNSSPHTIKAYATDLEQFSEFVGDLGWSGIDHVTVRSFLSHLYDRGLSKTSVARALAAVRSLYKWLGREGLVMQNPAKLVATPRLPKKLPRVPTIEEMNSVLDTQMPESAAFPERDRAIFELLYGCGIRNSELVGINLEVHGTSTATLITIAVCSVLMFLRVLFDQQISSAWKSSPNMPLIPAKASNFLTSQGDHHPAAEGRRFRHPRQVEIDRRFGEGGRRPRLLQP